MLHGSSQSWCTSRKHICREGGPWMWSQNTVLIVRAASIFSGSAHKYTLGVFGVGRSLSSHFAWIVCKCFNNIDCGCCCCSVRSASCPVCSCGPSRLRDATSHPAVAQHLDNLCATLPPCPSHHAAAPYLSSPMGSLSLAAGNRCLRSAPPVLRHCFIPEETAVEAATLAATHADVALSLKSADVELVPTGRTPQPDGTADGSSLARDYSASVTGHSTHEQSSAGGGRTGHQSETPPWPAGGGTTAGSGTTAIPPTRVPMAARTPWHNLELGL